MLKEILFLDSFDIKFKVPETLDTDNQHRVDQFMKNIRILAFFICLDSKLVEIFLIGDSNPHQNISWPDKLKVNNYKCDLFFYFKSDTV